MSRGSITVLMPAYNAGAFIRPAIQSILDQTYANFEFLIVDDGSTDNTPEIIASFADPRIKYLQIPHGGLGNALNFGLAHASHPVVARMDADDISLPDRLEKQVAFFTELPYGAILSCRYLFFSNNKLWGYIHSPTEHHAIKKRLALHNEITHTGVIYNRDFILGNGGYSKDTFEDFDLWLRLRDKATFWIMEDALVLIHYRESSLSRRNITRQYDKIYKLLAPAFSDDLQLHSFGLSKREVPLTRGWREYFFGNAKQARAYWKSSFSKGIFSLRVALAFIMSFLPQPLFIAFKENRFRFRLDYYFKLSRTKRKYYQSILTKYLG